jgi:xanthine dehydrogenase accessory factor
MQVEPCVLVTVGPVKGSAPRSPGTRMLVSRDNCRGSIGGGNLEFTAINRARELLEQTPAENFEVQFFGLGPALNQCCGGSVQILFELFEGKPPAWLTACIDCIEHTRDAVLLTRFSAGNCEKALLTGNYGNEENIPAEIATAAQEMVQKPTDFLALDEPDKYWLEPLQKHNPQVFLFGAGHVGKALVNAFEPLPFNITWIDSRANEFPDIPSETVSRLVSADPLQEVTRAPVGAIYLVMTHSHQLDEDLCHAILERADFAWLGLIGSVSKRRRFTSRLSKRGIDNNLLDRMVCPIGMSGIKGKQPATIAVAVAAQLLSEFHQAGEQ